MFLGFGVLPMVLLGTFGRGSSDIMRSFGRRAVGGLVGLLVGVLGFAGPGPVVAVGEPLLDGGDVLVSSNGEGFSDLADAGVHQASVEILAEEGIIDGTECAAGRFCPQEPIQRWVMAVWLVRAVDGVDPEAVSFSRFVDVDPTVWWVRFVERLVDRDITRGCSTDPARFCPTEPVTRQQMASFLVRAFELAAVGGNRFVDVIEGNSHLGDVNALAAAGVSAGCAVQPDRYCPARETTRAQMATFLARAMGLVDISVRDSPLSGTFTSVAVGRGHACGLRTEGTVVCWGPNWWREVYAPDGLFKAVAAGVGFSCGLRTEGTITCWGSDEIIKSPEGVFTSVSASADGTHSCGLRADGTVTCWGWGWDGETQAPEGVFIAVTAGKRHSCGLRSDGMITCWGWEKAGATNPPAGVFTAVSSGGSIDGGHSCGLRTDQTVVCWGNNSKGHGYYGGQTDAPRGKFIEVAAGYDHSCGIRPDQTVSCWGNNPYGGTDPPDGEFATVSPGYFYTCGLRTDATITCWGVRDIWVTDVPDVDQRFTTVDVGDTHACGVKEDHTIVCWGDNSHQKSEPPPGTFTDASVGVDHSCGLRTDGTVICWGNIRSCIEVASVTHCFSGSRIINGELYDLSSAKEPEGKFTDLVSGDGFTCGLRTDQTITCWGGMRTASSLDTPGGKYTGVAAGLGFVCGLRTDTTITCWAEANENPPQAPQGQFVDVAAFGFDTSCGLRTDHTITCRSGDSQWDPFGTAFTLVPVGPFTSFSASPGNICGIQNDGTITCRFGDPPPPGAFSTVSVGHRWSCAIATDQTLTCWGPTPTAAPTGVTWYP